MDTKQKHIAALRKARAVKLTKQALREAEKARKKAELDQLKAIVKAEREAEIKIERAKRKAEREAEKVARALEAAKQKEPTPLERWQQECDNILDELQSCPKNAAELMRRYSELQYKIETEQNMQDPSAAIDRQRASREVQVVRSRPTGLSK